MVIIKCPYCNKEAEKVTGRVIYPHRPDLYDLLFYRCEPCEAYIGTHKKTGKPLGTLAKASLRRARISTHQVFDAYWEDGTMSRNKAYALLAQEMGIPPRLCHIGLFNEDQCREVYRICGLRGLE